ncbi:MAG: DUF1579 family protein [Phycisphaerales bacterium JB043]
MNRTTLGALAAGVIMGGGAMYSVTAQQDGQAYEIDMDAMMEVWLEAGRPGPEHEEMAKSVGSFNAHGTMYMPDGSTSEWHGTVEKNAIFGGRYILEHYKVQDMGMFGEFEGYGVAGFNKATGKYEQYWIDSLSTMMLMSKGEKHGNKIVMYGSRTDPMSGETQKTKSVTTINDDGTFVLDMYMVMPEGEMHEMTINHTPIAGDGDEH